MSKPESREKDAPRFCGFGCVRFIDHDGDCMSEPAPPIVKAEEPLTGPVPDERWVRFYRDRAERAEVRVERLEAAIGLLILDANRLCDRNLGGTYEDDCRRAIAKARAALAESADRGEEKV